MCKMVTSFEDRLVLQYTIISFQWIDVKVITSLENTN